MTKTQRTWAQFALMALCGVLAVSSAMAQEKNDAQRKVQLQVRKLQQEKSALEARLSTAEQEKTALIAEKESVNAKFNSAQARSKAESTKQQQLLAALDAANRDKAELQARRTELEGLLLALTAKQAAADREIAVGASQKRQLESALQDRQQQVAVCEDKNLKLYSHGRDLIRQCQDRGIVDTVLRVEPFTGLGKVEMENLMEEYRSKLDANKLSAGGTSR
jgi:chromosome segregation ATPase